MIIVMKRGASPEQLKHVEDRVREAGMVPHTIHGVERHVVAAVGEERHITPEFFKVCAGVDKVMPVLDPYKLASTERRKEPSVVELPGGARIGGRKLAVIAGPCTVEDKGGLIETARAVKEAGAVALRGGAFKPRTDPYTFRGLEEKALIWLAEAREATGLPVVTEVMSPADVKLIAKYADVLQIGTRNMQNFNLLEAVGESGKPVLVKRGMSATLDEWILAAEYVLRKGNKDVVLCERGIRTFEDHVRNTLALVSVPSVKARSHLPVLVDPSHGTGKASLVAPASRAAVAIGADGLIVEVHPDPERAILDGGQSLNLEQFAAMMAECRAVAESVGRTL
jgi:3-deoxy-7-phosphoheptulonate synthase